MAAIQSFQNGIKMPYFIHTQICCLQASYHMLTKRWFHFKAKALEIFWHKEQVLEIWMISSGHLLLSLKGAQLQLCQDAIQGCSAVSSARRDVNQQRSKRDFAWNNAQSNNKVYEKIIEFKSFGQVGRVECLRDKKCTWFAMKKVLRRGLWRDMNDVGTGAQWAFSNF